MEEGHSLFAHTPRAPGNPWHLLTDHLLAVGEAAAANGSKFGAESVCRVLGLAHDLGKADPRFQIYLRACFEGLSAPRCPHSAAGAVAVLEELGAYSLAILGHHQGLLDRGDAKAAMSGADAETARHAADLWTRLGEPLTRSASLPVSRSPRQAELLIRMAFSALVDADYLDTEKHFRPHLATRRGSCQKPKELCPILSAHMATFANKVGTVNSVRAEVLAGCQSAAALPQGVFRLSVPTGGGKTLASLSFALGHAAKHNLDRVICAIPYTSIIDQTAQVYREVLGTENVLEHHSAAEPGTTDEGQTPRELRSRLSAENWDSPLIVTTTVQLFESLFASRPSRCRKLHNVARSVIVLDEVQTLPPNLLQPILDVLHDLVAHFGCTVLFCTATQPDFTSLQDKLPKECYALLSQAREITADPDRHFDLLRRVEFSLEPAPLTESEVAQRIANEPMALCVLNTRKDAVRVLRKCTNLDGVFHLSTLLCPHHRQRVLKETRRRLKERLAVRLVSTQVVEAGVDLDFPFVMRDIGPLDRIVQVAGRCNREGRMEGLGRCLIFELAGGKSPRGAYATGLGLTRTLLSESISTLDRRSTIAEYFRELYRYTNTDSADIQRKRANLSYETVSRDFQMIPDETVALVVERYQPPENPGIIEELLTGFDDAPPMEWHRRLRPYCVALPKYEVEKMTRAGLAKSHQSGLLVYDGPYDELFGVGSGEERDPADLID